MSIPQTFTGETDPCSISSRWTVSVELAERLVQMARSIPFGLVIYSGYRSPEHQDRLRQEGRPTADNDKSTHLSCPATGADVKFAVEAANYEKSSQAQFGLFARMAGLRWGGGSPADPDTGIPSDWNHLDLGPRNTP